MPKNARMPALHFDDTLRYLPDYPLPHPGPGEALIRVTLAGICATDLQIMAGYKNFRGILGHEFVGRVAAAPGHEHWVGQRVVGDINCPCGHCPTCARGEGNHCPARQVVGILGRDGAMASFLTLPVANLHPVPQGLDDQQAIFTEPLAAALQITERLHVPPSRRVLILGDGRLGNLTAQVLALTGCALTVLGRHPRKMALLQSLGIPTRHEDQGIPQAADLVIDCSGRPEGLARALAWVAPRGRVVVKSTLRTPLPLDLAALVVNEITVIGSRCGPFPAALRLLHMGRIQTQELVDGIYPLADGILAFEKAATGLKVLLKP